MNITAQDFSRRLSIIIATRCFLGIASLTIVFLFSIKSKHELSSPLVFPFYIYALLLLFFTAAGGILLSYSSKQLEFAKKTSLHGKIQLAFDIFSVSLFVYFSGGIVSPFSGFYILVIIAGALLFGLRGAILTGAICYIAYGLIIVNQFYGLFPVHVFSTNVTSAHELKNVPFIPNLLSNMFSFFITASLSGLLVDKWHIAEEHFKASLSQLKFLRSLHENVLGNIPSGVIVINHDKTIAYANKMAGHILGIHHEKLVKRHINDFINFDFGIDEVKHLTRREIECQNHSTGESIILGYTLHLVPISPKSHVWIFLFQDLTDIKRLQKEIEEAERMSFVGRIAANIAHNIKNPLGAIHGAAQLIEKEFSYDPTVKKAAEIILKETKKIDRLVRDFMKLSLSSLPSEHIETVEILHEIQKICQEFQTQTGFSSRYSIVVKNEATKPLRVSINPTDLEISVWNLLLNAVEAMPNGGDIEITLKTCSKNPNGSSSDGLNYACISIKDHGKGISPDIKEKIFQPFFTTKPGGTGLGLTIVNQITRKYSGFIHLTSIQNEGTEFNLYFPAV